MEGANTKMDCIDKVAEAVKHMEEDLRRKFLENGQEIKLWENTYVKHQIDKRESGYVFSLSDHICGMVYSMLSSGSPWQRLENSIDIDTGRIVAVDELFHQYDAEYLLQCKPDYLIEEIKKFGYAGRFTEKYMKALIETNIKKLKEFEKQYGNIDVYYQQLIEKDATLKSLVKALSDFQSKDKMEQMAEALVSEYLRNVGYDLAKPDRHLSKILGSTGLGCSDKAEVPPYEVIDIVAEIADSMGRRPSEVDYILWASQAKGYGEKCIK